MVNLLQIMRVSGMQLAFIYLYETDTFFDTGIRSFDGIRKQRMQFMRP
jgi:hypothetical protein